MTTCVLLTCISSCVCLWSITPTCNQTCTYTLVAASKQRSRRCIGPIPNLPVATTQNQATGSGAEARLLPGNTPPFYPPAILLAGRRAMTSKGARQTLCETDRREEMSRNKPTAICRMRLSGIHEEVEAWERRMWMSFSSYELRGKCQHGQVASWGWCYS